MFTKTMSCCTRCIIGLFVYLSIGIGSLYKFRNEPLNIRLNFNERVGFVLLWPVTLPTTLYIQRRQALNRI